MEAYFDNSATTRCYDEVREVVSRTMTEDFGNPSAMHKKGMEAEQYVKNASRVIAGLLKVSEKEIIFTSGGTESDNMALIGGAMANKRRGMHIIISSIEHPAVAEPAAFLEEQGFEVTRLPSDQDGVIQPETLEKALRPDTILVSVMYVNNETGSVMAVDKMGEMIHKICPETLFHVDAIQAFGKYTIHPARCGIDLLSVSGHKIHAPKGTGFLYIRNGIKIKPLILGGGQMQGMRSGTENVPGIAGLAAAAEIICRGLPENTGHLCRLKEKMAEGLKDIPEVYINGMPVADAAPHIMNVSFTGIRSEVLLHALEEQGIYVSAGSACSSHKRKPSAVLTAMGLPKARIESAVRISFCEQNTEEEVDYCLSILHDLVPVLRRYSRR